MTFMKNTMVAVFSVVGLSHYCDAFVIQHDDSYVKVEVKGKLTTGVMAIGGETTGTLIKAGNIQWELDLSKKPKLAAKAKMLNGKTVYVTGKLQRKSGVEIRQRWIVHVETLSTEKPGGGDQAKSEYLNAKGQLKHTLVLREAQGGFAGFSGKQITIEQNGKWKIQSFLNQNLNDPSATGKLSGKEMIAVAKILAKYKINQLPGSVGKPVGANPRIFEIRFGKHQSKLTLPPGGTVARSDGKKFSQEQRIVFTWQDIQKLLTK